jgi:subtilisin family serine protease
MDVRAGLTKHQHRVQVGPEEIALLEGPGAFMSAAARPPWPEADEPVTLIAVRREWPHTPTRGQGRSVLASWRRETGELSQRATSALNEHGFSREDGTDLSEEGYVLLPHAEAVIVRADPQRATEAADILASDFLITPDVVLRAPMPPPRTAEKVVTDPNALRKRQFGWPEESGIKVAHSAGNRGQGAVIGVFDTGCDADHVEFRNRTVDFVYVPPGDVERQVRGFATNWHGTHVTAIAAGRRRGVAPGATLLAAGVIESETHETTLRRLVIALNWFQRRLESEELANAPAVLNLSLGFRAESLTSFQVRSALVAVRALLAHLVDLYGVLIVAAVGNDGPTAGPRAPAFFPTILSTGAISFGGTPAEFSSGGPGPSPFEMIHTPHLVGYGVDVMSAMQRDVSGTSLYLTASGTSMAAPYVTGIAALTATQTGLQGLDLADHLISNALPLSHPPNRVGAGLARVT